VGSKAACGRNAGPLGYVIALITLADVLHSWPHAVDTSSKSSSMPSPLERGPPARKGIQQSGISDPFGEVKSAYPLKSDLGKGDTAFAQQADLVNIRFR
jgi:hypothetical protein